MPQNRISGFDAASISAAIREIESTVVLVRVHPARPPVTHLFGEDFYRMLIDRRAKDEATRIVRCGFGELVNWRRAHDFHVPTETLYLTPEPHESGYIPEDDHTFGLSPRRRITIPGGERR